ncbi:insecticidal delta-endotoxin Cry8Ea1 family protein [Bacillus thuringiensis]|uniref:insecticidal delta-endotoxin Cry8Ea1 family protein n=1 Tax=Bacillus thuringiensis TaxID=1428 RepID=UPI003458D626
MKRNNDCNDGIQTSDMSDRYPYANDPNTALQNIDYKDLLVMSQQCSGNLDDLERDTSTAVITGMNIAGTLMWGFVTGPVAGPVASVIVAFSTLLPILLPESEDPKKIWGEFMKHSEMLLDKKIADTEKERAFSTLQGFMNVLESYEEALNEWKKKPDRSTALKVSTRFEIAHSSFLENMPHLQLPSYKTLLLSCYAQAANLHLNLLHQGAQLADEWSKDIQTTKSNQDYYEKLIQRTEIYSDYCTETYREGLDQLKNAPNITWNIYNTYRRDMTLMVLDLIALFPLYDVRKYSIGGKTELTREVYTDALTSKVMDKKTNINEFENSLIRKPHLFSWLKGMNFATEKNLFRNNLSGIKNQYNLTGNPIVKLDKNWHGEGSDKSNVVFTVGSPITSRLTVVRNIETNSLPNAINCIICTVVDNGVSKSEQIYNAGKAVSRMTKTENIQPIERECNQTNAQPCEKIRGKYSHILSYALILRKKFPNAQPYYYMYSFAWTHHSVDDKNKIAEDIITQIPAVKAMDNNNDFSVIKGPGHTGGDVVKLSGITYEGLQVKCVFPQNKKYKIRLRYAANNATNVNIIIPDSDGESDYMVEAKSTYSSNTYDKYTSFQYLDTEAEVNVDTPDKAVIITIKNALKDTSIILDKIEFIPQED